MGAETENDEPLHCRVCGACQCCQDPSGPCGCCGCLCDEFLAFNMTSPENMRLAVEASQRKKVNTENPSATMSIDATVLLGAVCATLLAVLVVWRRRNQMWILRQPLLRA